MSRQELSNVPDSLGQPAPRRGAALAGAFGAAVAMWAAGYFGRIPPPHGWLPPSTLLFAFAGIQFAAGFLIARAASTRVLTATITGIGTGLINLLVLGALLREDHAPMDIVRGTVGLLATAAVVSAAGYALGALAWSSRRVPVNWTGVLALVALSGTFVLVIAGGLVTGHEAGLAVVDWPNTEGRLMFLYPLSKMTGGVYYEHSHRLYGALVGLTTIALAFQVWRAGPRQARLLAVVAVALVIVQGVLGGLRVTGEFTLATDAADTRPNLLLAIVHGVLAQVFLGLIALFAAMTSTTWSSGATTVDQSALRTTRKLSLGVVVILFLQLVLGALYRHLSTALDVPIGLLHGILGMHVVVAAVLLGWIIVQGFRQATRHRDVGVVRRLGLGLIAAVAAQIIFGVLALLAVVGRGAGATIPPWEVIITTAHQATGALLIALGVSSTAFLTRLTAR